MSLGSPSAPKPPPRAPEAALPPTLAEGRSGESTAARDAKRRRAAGGDERSTILTSARGVQDGGSAVAQKTLLGA